MARVLVSCPLPGDAVKRLRAEHTVVVLGADRGVTPERLHAEMRDADALLCMLTDPIPRQALLRAERLRVVANCAVGFDNIDVDAAKERGIVVCNTPNVLTEATADFAWALLLAAARQLVPADAFVRAGRFDGWKIGAFLGLPVHGQTLGIVGLGRIGTAVARRARGFSLRVVYSQRERADPALERELGAERLALPELLAQSDFVSLHVPLRADTRHLIDASALARMKPTAVLVNTARGPIVDEAALAAVLGAGRLAAAGLDVFEREPAVLAELLCLDNVVLAPHIASATEPTRARMASAVADDILRVLRGEPPENRVA